MYIFMYDDTFTDIYIYICIACLYLYMPPKDDMNPEQMQKLDKPKILKISSTNLSDISEGSCEGSALSMTDHMSQLVVGDEHVVADPSEIICV